MPCILYTVTPWIDWVAYSTRSGPLSRSLFSIVKCVWGSGLLRTPGNTTILIRVILKELKEKITKSFLELF